MYLSSFFHLENLSFHNLHPLYFLTSRLSNKVLSFPSDAACWISSRDWVEQSLLLPRYYHLRDQYKEYLPKLETDDQAIVESLNKEGIFATSLEALAIPNSRQFLEAAEPIARKLAQLACSPSHIGKHTLMADAKQLLKHQEVLCWGLSEKIIKIVESYLGLPVAYGGLSFYHSVADGRDAGPRIWHRDKEDWKMIKVGVYLNDVDEAGGPFQCIKSDPNTWLVETLPKYKGLIHSELKELLNINFSNWLFSCVGNAGTVFFVDTSRYYHRGKPPETRDRTAIFFHYFSYRPKNPFYCDRSPLSNKEIIDFDKQLPSHLQGYLTWRNKYSGIGRYIPKNYMRVDNW